MAERSAAGAGTAACEMAWLELLDARGARPRPASRVCRLPGTRTSADHASPRAKRISLALGSAARRDARGAATLRHSSIKVMVPLAPQQRQTQSRCSSVNADLAVLLCSAPACPPHAGRAAVARAWPSLMLPRARRNSAQPLGARSGSRPRRAPCRRANTRTRRGRSMCLTCPADPPRRPGDGRVGGYEDAAYGSTTARRCCGLPAATWACARVRGAARVVGRAEPRRRACVSRAAGPAQAVAPRPAPCAAGLVSSRAPCAQPIHSRPWPC